LFIVTWTVPAARRHEPHEVWASLSLGAFISLLFMVYSGAWETRTVDSLIIPAIVLQVVALVLIAGGFHALRASGRPAESSDQPAEIVRSGVYRVVRHPIYLGMALWAISIGIGRYSLASAILAGIIAILALLASITEEAHNMRKFGAPYAEYKRTLPF
jgi:protein-S-isoprenylcysteine O-methyltransferase Ste14